MRRELLLCLAILALPWSSLGAAEPRAGSMQDPLFGLAQDLCQRQVVLLGEEASHSSAGAVIAKGILLKHLIQHCGFDALLFESAIYDFIHYQRLLAKGEAQRDDLSAAIGGLWAGTHAFDPLLDELHSRAQAGQLRIGGIDIQLGSATARFARDPLADELVSGLTPKPRKRCRSVFARHHGWQYSQERPFDDAERARLAACVDAVLRGIRTAPRAEAAMAKETEAMAQSYRAYLDQLAGVSGARTHGMVQNVVWHQQRWPRQTRIVIWTATLHAVHPEPSTQAPAPLGTQLRMLAASAPEGVASIGFSALSGVIGRRSARKTLTLAPSESLESLALAGGDMHVAVLNHSALRAAGARPSRLLHPEQWRTEAWSDWLDAVVVLREEQPLMPRSQ